MQSFWQRHKAALLWRLSLGMGSFAKRLFSTITEQDFNQNVVEVAYSICLAAYRPIARNVGTWLGIKDEYTVILISYNVATMVTNRSKRYLFRDSYTLCLCWMHWFVSHLIYLSLTKPSMQQCFHPSTKYLLYRYITSTQRGVGVNPP